MVQTSPTPFDVGRAFVHQYYTLLHQAPHLLHRFYSTDSTFVHGGVDRPGCVEQPAVGSESISRRINDLNLRDCHAKIRQVDSHPTINDGVVVQVTGELSNNGDPMRRFMQTFVLAPRQLKKYYVQNDIFRYQDEVFDEASDEDDRSSSHIYGDTDKVSNADLSTVITQQSIIITATSRASTEEQKPLPPRNINQTIEGNQQQQQVIPIQQKDSTSNTNINEQQEETQQQSKQTTITEGTSYAGIAKLHSSTGPTTTTLPPPQQQTNTIRSAGIKPVNNQQRNNQWNDNSQHEHIPSRRSGVNQTIIPNEQQVFVGSLPLEFTKENLIECFSQFGNIIDAKIHAPMHDNKKNFGFVIYDDPNVATKVVKMEHITYNNTRLNLEPKIQRNYSSNGSQGNNRNNNYQTRGGRGGGGGGGNRGFNRGTGNNQRRGGHFPNNSSSFNGGDENNKLQQQQ